MSAAKAQRRRENVVETQGRGRRVEKEVIPLDARTARPAKPVSGHCFHAASPSPAALCRPGSRIAPPRGAYVNSGRIPHSGMPRDRAAAAICPVPALHIRHVIYSRKRVKSHVMQYERSAFRWSFPLYITAEDSDCGLHTKRACGQNDG